MATNRIALSRPLRWGAIKNRIVDWITFALMALVAATTVGPFVIMLSVSLTKNMSVITFPLPLIPRPFTLGNFTVLFQKTMVLRWLLNSVYVTGLGTLCTLITSSMAGYAFARGDFIGKAFWFTAFLGIFMVPLTARIVPLFIVMTRLGLANTYWVLFMPQLASMFGTFMLRQQYLTIPRDYDDAAVMDGASRFLIFSRVLLPQIGPALATLAVLRFMGSWNSFLYPMIMTTRARLQVLPVGLATVARSGGDAGLDMAGAAMGFLPTFFAFLIGQKYVIQGITMSGIKG